jgi:hypothetical protein
MPVKKKQPTRSTNPKGYSVALDPEVLYLSKGISDGFHIPLTRLINQILLDALQRTKKGTLPQAILTSSARAMSNQMREEDAKKR